MKKPTRKSLKEARLGKSYKQKVFDKYLFVARGPGETSQARALARYVASKGKRIIFCLHQEKNLPFLSEDKDFRIFVTPTPQQLTAVVKKEKPGVILLFNSKMWGRFRQFFREPPLSFAKSLTICVDSNWLFNNIKYPSFHFIPWAEKYLVLFSKKIFELGLKQNEGHFVIPEQTLKRIVPVGFIPSYKIPAPRIKKGIRQKYGLGKTDKFIFAYFSGFGAGHRVFAFNNLIKAVDKLVKKGRKIKVLYIGPTADLDTKKLKRAWLIKRASIPTEEYFLTLASSDAVFQHQGMVTLAQAISARVPVICNVHILKNLKVRQLHFWEVEPFKRAGACEVFSRSTSCKTISRTTEDLLYHSRIRKKMQKNQRLIFKNGEKKAFKIIENCLRQRDI